MDRLCPEHTLGVFVRLLVTLMSPQWCRAVDGRAWERTDVSASPATQTDAQRHGEIHVRPDCSAFPSSSITPASAARPDQPQAAITPPQPA